MAFAKTILFTYKLPRVVGIKSLKSSEKAHDALLDVHFRVSHGVILKALMICGNS